MRFKELMRFFFYLLISFMLLFIQCKKKKLTDDTYFGSKVIILGHRGMGAQYKMPGDTYESIAPAVGIGCDGCEIDIHMTKDTALVLYHSTLLDPHTTCNGRINELTLDEVRQCEFHAVKNGIFICSAEELFSKLPDITSLYFSFDCKVDYEVTDFNLYQAQYLRAVKRLCDKYNMSQNVFVEGFQSFLIEAQKMGLSNKLFLAGALTQAHIDTAVKYSFFGISSQMDDFGVDADVAHEKGLYVMEYTPYNYYLNLSAINKKVDILQTDDPISILKRFDRYNYDYVIP